MASAPSADTRIQKKQARILDIAAELFLERGYDAVSLDDILERAGGSKSTLYSYYGGKEGLFAAIVKKSCHDRLTALTHSDVIHLDPGSGLNAIGRMFLSLISDPKACALYRMMIAEAERFPDLATSFYKAGPQVTIGVVCRALEDWQKRGLLRGGNAETLAVQFIGIIMGKFNTMRLLGLGRAPSDKQIEAWVKQGVTLFLEGALPR